MLRISSLQARLTAPTESSRANATSTDPCSQHTRTYAGAANYQTAGAQAIDKTAWPKPALSTAPGPGHDPKPRPMPGQQTAPAIFIPLPLLQRHRHRPPTMNITTESLGAPQQPHRPRHALALLAKVPGRLTLSGSVGSLGAAHSTPQHHLQGGPVLRQSSVLPPARHRELRPVRDRLGLDRLRSRGRQQLAPVGAAGLSREEHGLVRVVDGRR